MDKANTEPTNLDDTLGHAAWTPRHIVILILCLTINFLDGIDISIMAYVAPVVSEEWNINYGLLGLLFAAVLIGIMFGSIFISPIADAIGRRPVALVGILVINLTTIAIAYVDTVTALIVLRFLTGLGLGAVGACLSPILAEYMPARWRKTCVNLMAISLPGGAVVGAFCSAWIIHNYSWQDVFLFAGLAGLLIFFVALSLLPESVHILAKNNTENALEKINGTLASLKIPLLHTLPKLPIQKSNHLYNTIPLLFTDKLRTQTILLSTIFTLSYATVFFLKSWIPKLLTDTGMTLGFSINIGATMSLGGIIGGLILGLLAVYFKIARLILTFLFIGSFFMIWVAVDWQMHSLFLLVALIGFFVFGGFVSLYTLTVSIYPPEIRSTALGLSNGLGRTGAIAGMFIPSFLAASDNAISHNMIFFSIPLVISAALIFYIQILDDRSTQQKTN